MKLSIKRQSNQNICLYIPTGLLLNPVSVFLLRKIASHNGISLSKSQANAMAKAWKQCKKTFKGWKLLEAESSSGDFIEILP